MSTENCAPPEAVAGGFESRISAPPIAPHWPADAPYALPGSPVEPGAAFWLLGDALSGVSLPEITAPFRAPQGGFRADVLFPTEVDGELAELRLMAARREEPLPDDYLSLFFTAVDEARRPSIRAGGDLARLINAALPGSLHVTALERLLAGTPPIAPVRQARIVMAIGTAVYSAYAAAWFFKWAAGEGISRRLRPYEHPGGRALPVLLDAELAGVEAQTPLPSPGTPRHPSYPSGHSSAAAAASRVLEYVFSPETLALDDRKLACRVPPEERGLASPAGIALELRQLAANIGEARLWAGVNWRSDHSFGRRLGDAVADRVIAALRTERVEPLAGGADIRTP